jgi:hypothetical protein
MSDTSITMLMAQREALRQLENRAMREQLQRAWDEHQRTPMIKCLFEGLPKEDGLGHPQFYMLACPCPKCRPTY